MYYQIEEKGSRPYQPSRAMARYVAGIKPESLTPGVVRGACRSILDLLGAALAGSLHADIAPPVLTWLKGRGGAPEASLWGDGARVPVESAAFWAGCIGHALELDDGHREGAAHIGTVVVPAALTLGEHLGSSGLQVITAVVAGYEVMGRVSAGINPRHFLRGFHTTGCTGPFGSVAAASVLLGLDEQQARGALGTAGVQFTGLLEVVTTGQMVKGIHAGRAAEAGVIAARLARLGVSGPEAILEGPKGYVHAMTDVVDWDRMIDRLGTGEPEVLKAYTKPYPTCRHCHPAIELALDLFHEVGPLAANQVREIRVATHSVGVAEVGQIKHPRNNQEAKFSGPWSVACALRLGRASLADFADDRLQDLHLQALASKVEFEVDPAMDQAWPRRRGATLTLALGDGRTLTRQVDLPKGEPETALTDAEMESKFVDLAAPAVGVGRAEQIVLAVRDLERITKVGELTALLRVSK